MTEPQPINFLNRLWHRQNRQLQLKLLARIEAEIADYLRNQKHIDEIKRLCGVPTGEAK